MNTTAVLVKEWAAYEETHEKASIEDFCRYYLVSQPGAVDKIAPNQRGLLARMIGRLSRLHAAYTLKALREVDITSVEEFTYLNSIADLKEPRKTDVIYRNFHELSSGLLIIDRLKKKGYINEHANETDKRSRLLMLSVKGRKKLEECYLVLRQVNEFFYLDLSGEDTKLCLQLLSPVENKFAALWLQHKDIMFSNIYGTPS